MKPDVEKQKIFCKADVSTFIIKIIPSQTSRWRVPHNDFINTALVHCGKIIIEKWVPKSLVSMHMEGPLKWESEFNEAKHVKKTLCWERGRSL